jgi:hypothetical protein
MIFARVSSMKPVPVLLFLSLFAACHCLAQSPYFIPGLGSYSETKKFADLVFPSKNFGAFGNGIGPELFTFFDNGGKELPIYLHTAAIFFPRHTIHEASGDVSVQQLLVPLEAAASRPLFNITKAGSLEYRGKPVRNSFGQHAHRLAATPR